MPKSLTQFLQISGQVSIRQVREARRAQGFFGGSLLYNLVHLKILPERKAQDLLAAWMNLPYAPLADFGAIPWKTLQLIDARVVARRRILPFQPREGELIIATARLGNDPFYRELAARTGLKIAPHAIMEEHLAPLLEKYYGIPATKRETIRLAAAENPLEHVTRRGGDTPAHGSTPGVAAIEVGLDGLPLNSDAIPSQILPTESDNPTALLDTVETIDDNKPPAIVEESSDPAPQESEPAAPAAGTSSPLQRLARARNRTEIGAAAVDHALALGIPRVALLGRRRESLVGWQAGGSGVTTDRFTNLTIPFYTPSIFAGFKVTGNPYAGVIPDQPANLEFLRALGQGAAPGIVAAVPVRLGSRTVAALYADGGPATSMVIDQEPLIHLAGKIAAALEILILRRKILA